MTTQTLTLSDFLLARVDEDELAIENAGPGTVAWLTLRDDEGGMKYTTVAHTHRLDDEPAWIADGHEVVPTSVGPVLWDSRRALAECEAKRRIVEIGWNHLGDEEWAGGMEQAKDEILVLLALPYADHPDFNEAWRL